jgi:hypothetical protein
MIWVVGMLVPAPAIGHGAATLEKHSHKVFINSGWRTILRFWTSIAPSR